MYPNTFYRVSVKALIRDQHNQILVLKENQDTWSLPGGGLDHGEDPKTGILRELKEELGINSAKISDKAIIKTFYLELKSAWLMWLVYEVEIDTDKFSYGDGVAAARYINLADLKDSQDIFEKMVCKVSK